MDLSTTLTKREKLRLVKSIQNCLLTASCAILERMHSTHTRKDSDEMLDQLHLLITTLICIFNQMEDSVKRLPRVSSRRRIADMYVKIFNLNYSRAVNNADAMATRQNESLPLPTIIFYINALSLIKNICYTYQNLIKILDIEEPWLATQGNAKDLLHCEGDLYYASQQIASAIMLDMRHDITKYRHTHDLSKISS